MLKRIEDNRNQLEVLCLEQLVPEEHLVRKIDKAIDFNFIYDEVKDLYSGVGRGSIDPVSLIKIALVQYMFGIKSMRQTIKELEVNVAYRWFCGFGITSPIPHFSTFGKNYIRRFEGTNVFENIFARILQEAINNGFVNTKAVFMDSTHIKASANKKKKQEIYVKNETKNYQKTLEQEINEERKSINKKEFVSKNDEDDIHKITKSTTDPDAGEFHKGEHEKMFAYSAHTICDKNAFVLDFEVTPANVHDSTQFTNLFNKVINKYNIKYIGLDAGYKTPAIAKDILENGIMPLMPYTRAKGNKREFKYNPYYNYYTCPQGNILEYTSVNRLGYREYKSDERMRKECPNYGNCISKSQKKKTMFRHIWSNYIEVVEEIRHTPIWKKYYKKRSETIERIFGDAKEKHGMRYTQLRGKNKVTLQVLLTFACMNLKKLANWKWQKPKDKDIKRKISANFHKNETRTNFFNKKDKYLLLKIVFVFSLKRLDLINNQAVFVNDE